MFMFRVVIYRVSQIIAFSTGLISSVFGLFSRGAAEPAEQIFEPLPPPPLRDLDPVPEEEEPPPYDDNPHSGDWVPQPPALSLIPKKRASVSDAASPGYGKSPFRSSKIPLRLSGKKMLI